MAFAVFVGVAVFHCAEKCVAGAEADGDLAGLDEAEADNARRIIAGPDRRERFGVESVFGDKVRTDRTEDVAGRREQRQFFNETRRGGFQRIVVPIFTTDVHEVHPRAIAEIYRRNFPGKQRCHE